MAKEKALIHLEEADNGEMRLKTEGDQMMVANMINTAMKQDDKIAAVMVAGVMLWADDQGIPRNKLGDMVKFYG